MAEHQKLSIENPLLKDKIKSLEELNEICEQQQQIKNEEIKLYEQKSLSDDYQIKKLKSTQKKLIFGSSVGGIILFIIGIIL